MLLHAVSLSCYIVKKRYASGGCNKIDLIKKTKWYYFDF